MQIQQHGKVLMKCQKMVARENLAKIVRKKVTKTKVHLFLKLQLHDFQLTEICSHNKPNHNIT